MREAELRNPKVSERAHRRFALRAPLLVALLAAPMYAQGSRGVAPAEALASVGVVLLPGSLWWIDPPGLGTRRALILARRAGERSDVYALEARATPEGTLLSEPELFNLTRSANADEEALVLQRERAAFVTRTEDGVVALTTIDLRGSATPGATPGARLRGMLTRVQRTGSRRGFGFARYELATPSRVARLTLRGARLDAQLDAQRIELDLATRRVLRADVSLRARERHESPPDNWLTWMVDWVRAVPWIGSTPIAWAEALLFRTRHAVHQARDLAIPERAADETANELDDLLARGAPSAVEGRVDAWPPAPLRVSPGSREPHEGAWATLGAAGDPFVSASPGAPPPMAMTSLHVERGRAGRAYLVAWDPRHVELHVAPGSQEPMGATGETGTGVIPRDPRVLTRLVGGFNGAFQGLHGEYGVYAEGTLLLPPKPYAATVAVLDDGSTAFGSWPREQREVPDTIAEFRQNLSALVDGGVFNPWQRSHWGAVLQTGDNDLRTARSGLCRTRDGLVVYLWGDELSPRGLGDAMLAARCEYGLHLDMNGPNTGFDLYRVARDGELPRLDRALRDGAESEGSVDGLSGFRYRARRLVRAMQHPAGRYLERNPRDFFYLLRREVLPGEAIRAPVVPALAHEGAWRVVDGARTAFPWPLARTRLRPDPRRPERWVNLLRVDPRRVAFAPAERSEGLVARVTDTAAPPATLRLSLAQRGAPRWVLSTDGEGIAARPLRDDATRGACVDRDGFLVMISADGVAPGLLSSAMELAGCGPTRVALGAASLVLPSGERALGDSPVRGASTRLALVAREPPGVRAIFSEVTPLPRAQWQPLQSQRVRYFPNPASSVTVRVRLAGERSFTLRLPGVGGEYFNNPAGRAAAARPPVETPLLNDAAHERAEVEVDASHSARPRAHRGSRHRDHGARRRRHRSRRHHD